MSNYQIKFSVGRVDRTAGVIYGVSLISTGPVVGHGLYADHITLQSVLSACQKVGNLKVKVNHTTDIESICGTLSNYRIDGQKLLADLTLLKSNTSYEWVLDVAEKLPSQIGLSIAFKPEVEKKNGKEFVRCEEIYSADIVDTPAANRDGLFDVGGLAATNVSTVVPAQIPTGHKRKGTVTVTCPNCEAHLETFSKLAAIHADAADKLDDYINSLEVAQRDNISSQNTEAEFAKRLADERLELEANLDKRASVIACRMLSKSGIKLSKIPDAETCMASGDTILDRLQAIKDPTQQGLFYQANKAAIQAAYQRQAAKNIDTENRVKATEI